MKDRVIYIFLIIVLSILLVMIFQHLMLLGEIKTVQHDVRNIIEIKR